MSKKLGKRKLAKELEVRHSMSETDAKEIIESILSVIQRSLLQGDSLVLPNIGSLNMKLLGTSKRTVFGKPQTVPARAKIQFRVSDNLKAALKLSHEILKEDGTKTVRVEDSLREALKEFSFE